MGVTALTPQRLVLESVPRVHFYEGGKRCPEDLGFPSALRAALEYLGDPQVGCDSLGARGGAEDWHLGCSYALHTVTSGIAFQQLWHPTGWEYADDPAYMHAEPAAPYRHAIEAMGYDYTIVTNPSAEVATDQHRALGPAADEAEFRARIAESLARGRPVIALGVIGPPEAGLIAGYDEGGDVLLGWSFFQNMPGMNEGVTFEPSGYYRKRDWYRHTLAVITLGERGERPRLKEILRQAYARAITLSRTETIHGLYGGAAALDAWARAMERDEEFQGGLEQLHMRYNRHQLEVGNVAEGRWYASVLLANHATKCGRIQEPEHLLAASSCYARMHRLMWDVWGVAGGIGADEAKVRQGTTPEARRRIAALLRQARDADAEAADALERAIAI